MYLNLETLPIITFWKVIQENNNVKLLDLDYCLDKIYCESDFLMLQERWDKLHDEYFLLKDDAESKYYIRQNTDKLRIVETVTLLETLLFDYQLLHELSGLLPIESLAEKEVVLYEELLQIYPKAKINRFGTYLEIAEQIGSIVKSQMNLYNEKVVVVEKKSSKKVDSIYILISKISTAVGIALNVNEMSVAQFLAWEQTAKEQIKSRQKTGKNGR